MGATRKKFYAQRNALKTRYSLQFFRRNSDDAAFTLLGGLAVGFRLSVTLHPEGGANAQTTSWWPPTVAGEAGRVCACAVSLRCRLGAEEEISAFRSFVSVTPRWRALR